MLISIVGLNLTASLYTYYLVTHTTPPTTAHLKDVLRARRAVEQLLACVRVLVCVH